MQKGIGLLVTIISITGILLFVGSGAYFFFTSNEQTTLQGADTVHEVDDFTGILPEGEIDTVEQIGDFNDIFEMPEDDNIALHEGVRFDEQAYQKQIVREPLVQEADPSHNVSQDSFQSPQVPFDLSLPFKIEDIDELNGEINPIGVVRFSLDEPSVGHSGLDVPLLEGAEVFAVDDGEIVLLGSAGDPWGGQKIFQLLEKTNTGEGWGFIYEHVTPRFGLRVGEFVKRNEFIATKTAPAGFTAHLQLSYLFNQYQYIRDVQCWVNNLQAEERISLNSWWDKYKDSNHLVSSWSSTFEEGKYPFRGLLDAIAYPGGPQLCYPLGTDVR